jgi:hypothetical protein
MDEGEHRRRRVRTRRGTPDAGTEPREPEEAAAPADALPEAAPASGEAPVAPARPEPPRPVAPAADTQATRRRAGPARAGGAEPAPAAPAADAEAAQAPVRRPVERTAAETYDLHTALGSDDRESERGLRGLVGGGSSQVGVLAAMRARDASRPTDDDLATAEATLTIVHRGWVPRDG